jgi:histidinol phosphatase-like PHP family hydrolase
VKFSDPNIPFVGLLRDLSHVQTSEHSRHAYKRAARAIWMVEEPVADLLARNELRKVPYIGPSSERVIREFADTGESKTLEQALERSGKRREVEQLRTLRTNFLSAAAVADILRRRMRGVVATADFRGDFQMHSTWSDGAHSIEQMVEGALERGHSRACVTDHSYGLPIAGGVSMADIVRQHDEIDLVNERYRGRFVMLKGIEANIRPDGSVDMEPHELALFDLVVASPHSLLRKAYDQTARMLRAVRHPGVHILGHPRGRMFSRPGVIADWDRVFAAAAEADVAIEIDGDPNRQDIDFELACRALDHGCIFALDSDGHSIHELDYSLWAVAHARLARIPADRVINCWDDDRLMEWAARKKRALS